MSTIVFQDRQLYNSEHMLLPKENQFKGAVAISLQDNQGIHTLEGDIVERLENDSVSVQLRGSPIILKIFQQGILSSLITLLKRSELL